MSEQFRQLTGKQRVDLFTVNRNLARQMQALETKLKYLTAERNRLKTELGLLRDIMKAQNKVFPTVRVSPDAVPSVPALPPRSARGTRDLPPMKQK